MTMEAGFDRDAEDRVAIVAEGGGMKGAYVVGVLTALYQEFGLEQVDYVTGVSSGAPAVAYYVSKQFFTGRAVWTDVVTDPEFINVENLLQGHPFFNIDHIVEDVFDRGIDIQVGEETVSTALDVEALKESETELVIPLTNAETVETDFMSSKTSEGFHDNIMDILRATMAEPYTYRQNVEINGNHYFDGSVLDPIPIDAPGVEDARKIIIHTRSREQFDAFREFKRLVREKRNDLASNLYEDRRAEAVRQNTEIYDRQVREMERLERQGDVVISPGTGLSSVNNSVGSITGSIRQGYMDTVGNHALRSFLSALKGWDRSDFYFRDE